MQIISTIETVMSLVNLIVQYEPSLEKDVKDIVAIVHKMRAQVALVEAQNK